MSPDAGSFFSRIKHNWFLFVLCAAIVVLFICLAVAVVGYDPGYGQDYPLPDSEGYAGFVGAWFGPAGAPEMSRLPAIDAYYREAGAVRERLTPADVRARALERGGFTYNPLYGATPQHGYAVSLRDHGQVYDASTITEDVLREYLLENGGLMKDPSQYIGGWINDGRLYLDVSVILQSEEEARKNGRMNDQATIYNLDTGETIYLKGPEPSATTTIAA